MRGGIRAGVGAGLAAVLMGCSSSGPSSDDLDGSTFTSTEVSGHELVADTAITLRFEDGRLSADGGCNTAGGPYEVDDGTLRWTGGVASTTMGCPDDLAAQDAWLNDLFTDGVDAELDGDALTLTSGDVTIDLTA